MEAQTRPERPVLATVVAIVGLIFGIMGLCAGPMSLSIYFVDLGPNPVVDVVKNNQLLFFYTIAAGVMGVFLTLIEVVGCIGLLTMKPWGRTLTMFYAGAALLLLLVGTGVNAAVILPAMMSLNDPAALGGAIGGVVGSCAGVVIPIGFLLALTRPDVVAAYSGEL